MVVASKPSHVAEKRPARSLNVRAVDRSIQILTLLAEHPVPMGVAELASRLKLSSTSVHRMLTTLVAAGWVEQNSRTARYRMGTKLLGVGAAGLITHPIVQHGREFIARLADAAGYDSYLSTLVGARVVYLARAVGKQGFDSEFEAGISMPAHALADGKVHLAYLPQAERQVLYEKTGLKRYTPQTIVDPGELEKEMATIRSLGYALDRGERLPLARAVAVPVMGSDGVPLLGMMCVGRMEFTPEYVEWLSQQMLSLAQELSEHLTVVGDMPKVNVGLAKYNLE